MNIRVRVFLIVIAGVIVLAVATGWYALHDPDRYIPKITAYLRQETGLRVQIRHMEVHVFPTLWVRVYGLEIKNPKPFPSGDFLNVSTLDAAVEKIPLLGGRFAIRSLVLYKPVIDVISDPDGRWNYQNSTSGRQAPVHFPTGVISDLQIVDGVLQGSNLIDPADAPGPVVLEMRDFSAHLKQIHFHPRSGSGSPGAIAGTLAADTVRFGSIHAKDLHAQLRVTSRQVTLKDFVAKTYRGRASGDFSLNYGGNNTTFKTSLRVSGIGMPYLLAEFQKGSPKMTGMLQADVNLAGDIAHTSSPLTAMHGTGNVTMQKGELPNLNTDKNMIEGALPPSRYRRIACLGFFLVLRRYGTAQQSPVQQTDRRGFLWHGRRWIRKHIRVGRCLGLSGYGDRFEEARGHYQFVRSYVQGRSGKKWTADVSPACHGDNRTPNMLRRGIVTPFTVESTETADQDGQHAKSRGRLHDQSLRSWKNHRCPCAGCVG